MKSYIKLNFETSSGKDLTLTVSDANEAVNAGHVISAMGRIVGANAIDGVEQIVKRKSAALYKVTTKTFEVA